MSYSGLFDGHHSSPHSLLSNGKSTMRHKLSKLFGKRMGGKKYNEILATLVDGAVGDTASVTTTRLVATNEQTELGGLRAIETVTHINRATTAADAIDIQSDLFEDYAPNPYVDDASGNGGGGKLAKGL